jgi:hypothetical protein
MRLRYTIVRFPPHLSIVCWPTPRSTGLHLQRVVLGQEKRTVEPEAPLVFFSAAKLMGVGCVQYEEGMERATQSQGSLQASAAVHAVLGVAMAPAVAGGGAGAGAGGGEKWLTRFQAEFERKRDRFDNLLVARCLAFSPPTDHQVKGVSLLSLPLNGGRWSVLFRCRCVLSVRRVSVPLTVWKSPGWPYCEMLPAASARRLQLLALSSKSDASSLNPAYD